MKEAIITDISGKYLEPTLVADSVRGVFNRREIVQPDEDEQKKKVLQGDDQPEEQPTVLVGYTVAVPLPDGLYVPTFDVQGYRQAMSDYDGAYAGYLAAMAVYDPEGEDPQPQPPLPVDGSSFWSNGLTQEEIEALQPKPVPSELDLLRVENAKLLLHVAELEAKSEQHSKHTTALRGQNAELDTKNEQLTQDHATLLLQLAEKGVI
ncbi:hypothetical protein [Paenibacillus apiarius]|uniref:Uncharacterized protein n=1 Tax=Paenibacillus apiarius TaxID=46240 RepID=A0ABT4DRJ2_9BACL|nr:hypothetical protein [Paenibacillus apiarius]MCY9516706.1 hypothetical protein [Paenibacillus apiarius]MCY9519896.1 hypothetical protein [Paenibacillus apiarius]MCY9553866.1 hypothetical protein [Paenibacillus apiarius]MCY9557526.1 hypothetical protein [Paenibacillus apiarius]MCY9685486.1 hypothetical protein [Paenibacillus apiarius]